MKKIILFALVLLLGNTIANAQKVRIDDVPMYGGMDRSAVPELRAADERLIADAINQFGSREKASMTFADQGFRFYGQDRLDMAMRRFNQAWLLDPNNPQVYWGFGSVLHDQEKMCDAMRQYEKALSFGTYIPGLLPDAARVISLCAIQDKTLAGEDRKKLHERSDALYSEAVEKDKNKGYVYASWASVLFWRENYAQSWAMVKKAREVGGQLPPKFLSMLRSKMPEP